jgi:hypothetical protein
LKTIYYLSYSDNAEKEGLVFPNELLEQTYSSGIWIINLKHYERIPKLIDFDVVVNNELKTFKMKKINGFMFQVDANNYGKFYFSILNLTSHFHKYVGNSKLINSNDRLFQVVPIDNQKLNNSCLKEGFFFVGRIDSNLN